MKLRVEYVVTDLDFGGAEIHVRDLAIAMHRRGHSVGVLSLLESGPLSGSLVAAGVPVFSLGVTRARPSIATMARALFRARRHLLYRRPQIVHSHMVHANLLMRAACVTVPSCRLICTVHSTSEGGAIRDLAYRLTNVASHLNTAVSDAARKRFVSARALPANSLTVHNFVDSDRFEHLSARRRLVPPFKWIAVGRLEKEKDYPTLFQALARVKNATLDIAGEGSEADNLYSAISSMGLGDRVRLLGLVPDVAEILGDYDAFVLSSRKEGFGLVIAEAMAAGLPVVVTDSGGPREILGDDELFGLVVPPSEPEALAAAMSRMMSLTDDERFRIAAAGRARVRSLFGKAACIDRWEEIYRAVVDG